jgi:dTDP-4-dehydrorhamnose 3,5-epimerase
MGFTMKFEPLELDGAWLAISDIHSDRRGSFFEWLRTDELNDKTNETFKVAQANVSVSKKHAMRGIHFSAAPGGQAKWVSCLAGSILDVVVDLRRDSKTYLKWSATNLDARSGKSLYIGNGLGHAFLALEDNSIVSYLLSTPYQPQMEHSINPYDRTIGIEWPEGFHILSQKDSNAQSLLEWEKTHEK